MVAPTTGTIAVLGGRPGTGLTDGRPAVASVLAAGPKSSASADSLADRTEDAHHVARGQQLRGTVDHVGDAQERLAEDRVDGGGGTVLLAVGVDQRGFRTALAFDFGEAQVARISSFAV
jgi:hypothetical protein